MGCSGKHTLLGNAGYALEELLSAFFNFFAAFFSLVVLAGSFLVCFLLFMPFMLFTPDARNSKDAGLYKQDF